VDDVTLLALTALLVSAHVGTVTTFGPGTDPASLDVEPLACPDRGRMRNLDASDPYVATARGTAPCGARLLVCSLRTGRCTLARRMDEGPRRARRGRDPWGMDVSAAVARALGGVRGYEPIVWSQIP
jgi:hypothetical protein